MMGPWYSCQMRPGECGMVSCFPQSHWNIITPFRFSSLPCHAWDTGIFLGQSRIQEVPVIFQVSRSLLCTSVASQEAQAVALSSVALTHSPGSPFGEGNGTPLQYSCLENPRDRGAWWAAVHGVTKSRTRLNDFTFTFHFHSLEKEMATHSSVLAWRIPGRGSLVGCHLWGRTESDTTDATSQQQQQQDG